MRKTTLLMTAAICLATCIGTRTEAQGRAPADWEIWAPGKTPQIAIAKEATPGERDAAAELQKYVAKLSGQQPSIVNEGEARERGVIFVGHTAQSKEIAYPAAARGDDDFAVSLRDEVYQMTSDPQRQRLTLRGGSDMATKFAVYDFLTRYAGVRWYMPTELFEVVPARPKLNLPAFDTIETPASAPRLFAYMSYPADTVSYTGERDPQFNTDRWIVRNRLSADGRLLPRYHSHNLFNVIVPSRDFDAHPEWFPLLGGKRFKPPADYYQNWQPEITNPLVVQKFVAAGREFFQKNTKPWQWFSLGINDGDGWSESPETQKANGPLHAFRGVWVRSEMYYAFVNQVAAELGKEFPNRKVGVIAYAGVLMPPATIARLQPNVNVVVCQESAQYFNDFYRDEDMKILRDWMRVANGNVYRYDYQSLNWTMPRYFPSLVADTARVVKEMGVKGAYTEDIPIWTNMGPLLWTTAQLYWNPNQDQKELTGEYFHQLFGRAAKPMRAYFDELEKVWMRPRAGRSLYGLGDLPVQTSLFTRADRLFLDKQIANARRAAGTRIEKKRVEFFAEGWKSTDAFLRESELALRINATTGAAKTEAALKLIDALEGHAVEQQEFDKREALLNGTLKRFSGGTANGWRSTMQAAAASALVQGLSEEPGGDSVQIAARLQALLARYKGVAGQTAISTALSWNAGPASANLLKNPEFRTQPPFELYPNKPENWVFWKNVTGAIKLSDQAVRITGADDAALLQAVAVPANGTLRVAVRYRTNADSQAQTYLRIDGQAGWISVRGEPSATERELSFLIKGPAKTGSVRILLLTKNQRPNDWIELSQPYIGSKTP